MATLNASSMAKGLRSSSLLREADRKRYNIIKSSDYLKYLISMKKGSRLLSTTTNTQIESEVVVYTFNKKSINQFMIYLCMKRNLI